MVERVHTVRKAAKALLIKNLQEGKTYGPTTGFWHMHKNDIEKSGGKRSRYQ